ncbi:tRNA pseudouridine55 synthase [Thermosulfidibacter takaii ABI70S6]|uniref:tRNA pseudouridine synthase B n=1 Tax=Thermosulfidibacter takaii (strain DSM 17441 / JCM 13301 / NBRC 103674 / ABI70S6) TaxID=1298851 RepID=A0A0S3QSH7_THET7|nr:tRNA pseudouridine(55) synthase TruB [Thermosulfidibacter takaii]BAT71260.1 tRNA pseudouridine55 synthase [Thermosulfidibacter takaii ABI70S6]
MEEVTGVIVINKKEGITSTRMVEKVKRLLKVKKAGHLGTLDPMATGVLPIAVGRATKLADIFMSLPKEYVGRVKLGILTDTYDREGKILREEPVPEITPEQIEKVLKKFVGEIWQKPPLYSAKRYKGKRLYQLAREGKSVEVEPKKVHIDELKLISYEPPYIKLYAKVGKGVYIRTLAKDIGEELGTVGTLWDLARTSAAGFTLEQAVTLDELAAMELEERRKLVIPLSQCFPEFPSLKVMGRLKWWVTVGNPVVVTPDELGKKELQEGEYVKILNEDSDLIAMGVIKKSPEGRWICHPHKVLYTS